MGIIDWQEGTKSTNSNDEKSYEAISEEEECELGDDNNTSILH